MNGPAYLVHRCLHHIHLANGQVGLVQLIWIYICCMAEAGREWMDWTMYESRLGWDGVGLRGVTIYPWLGRPANQ